MAPLPDLVASEIADLTSYFDRTRNAAAAWRAYSLARQHSHAVPDVIQAEIDRFAACISDVAEKAIQAEVGAPPVRFRSEELGQAWRGDGGGNPIGSLQDEWRDYQIFWAVLSRVNSGMKVGAAQAAVAAQKGVWLGVDSIDKIWKRIKRNG
ncbi:hypothetical protein KIP88_37570 [Bradyrhizobium sp. SRL28]|uniref:hypothetical protein n=1 Tax=Bradyrhizobium sp. SRL28 TaxID=2836178 RepID=UPI001BDE816B|nr:hypothetical protein [Bradyrhizobium sp. SRL28]MBT1516174.1 hypothetical protein [Bradyrhizobium sp. SRL28]